MDKKTLRGVLINERNRLSPEELRVVNDGIAAALFGASFYREATAIFIFVSIEGEPDTAPLIRKALSDGKMVCVPRTASDGLMEIVQVKDADTYGHAYTDWPRRFGIPEPPVSFPAIEASHLDLVIVPSLAVDQSGFRIGYGGGYYDRLIASFRLSDSSRTKRPFFAAIQYAAFLRDENLPCEPHDMPVDAIVTENGVFIPSSFV